MARPFIPDPATSNLLPVALGVGVVVVRTPFEDFTVRVQRGGTRPVGEQLELARWAASQFRLGIDMGEPAVARAARELVRLLDGGGLGFGIDSLSPLDRFSPFGNSFGGIATRLEDELLAGRLVVERERFTPLSERRDEFELELPPLPPPRRESTTRTFEVRFVDETGKAISGIDAEFTADGPQTRATNAAGIALLEGVQSSSAHVAILDPDALSKVLDPRWETFRPGKPPNESNTTEVVFRGSELGPFPLKAELPNTVVIKPPLGKLFVELWDKTGRVRHANRTYQISGPQSFEGTTNEEGRLLHEGVFQGDYTLSLTVDSFKGDPDETVEQVVSPLVALDVAGEPQLRMLGGVPISTLARLHMFFNTNKAFLLPTALASMKKLRRLYIENAPCKLLVVGHADTAGGPAFNDKLSLERARAVIAYLKDDVDTWFEFYKSTDAKKVWGKIEDHLMLISMPDFSSKLQSEDAVTWFQRTRGLSIDGTAGKETRTALISEYMSLDGTSLADFVGEIDAVAHGCGENFPLDDVGTELDPEPEDQKRDPGDRRVELFFFDQEFGISPIPPSQNSKPGSTEYPKWRERVLFIAELKDADIDAQRVTFAEMTDAHFRTNSAVVLPEGEDPNQKGEHQALTSVGLLATVLRFNEEHPGRTLLVAGHTDTAASEAFNQKLSEERAEVTLSLLQGGSAARERFKTLCDARHTVADVKQILSWVSKAIPGFDCAPKRIDDQEDQVSVRKFQTAYNANKATLNPDPNVAPLTVDGSVGKLTWGAVFDCYELALQNELGENPAALASLRAKLRFADDNHPFLGFSEHFPIEELGVDNFRSQANRRVEILFFEPGEDPDLDQAARDPETSELYLPGQYERESIPPMASALRRTLVVNVLDHQGFPVTDRSVTLFLSDGSTREIRTDGSGTLTAKVPLGVVSMALEDGRFLNFGPGYTNYSHDPVNEIQALPSSSDGALIGSDSLSHGIDDHNDTMTLLSPFDSDLTPLP